MIIRDNCDIWMNKIWAEPYTDQKKKITNMKLEKQRDETVMSFGTIFFNLIITRHLHVYHSELFFWLKESLDLIVHR